MQPSLLLFIQTKYLTLSVEGLFLTRSRVHHLYLGLFTKSRARQRACLHVTRIPPFIEAIQQVYIIRDICQRQRSMENNDMRSTAWQLVTGIFLGEGDKCILICDDLIKEYLTNKESK